MNQDSHPSVMGELVGKLDAAYVREERLRLQVMELRAQLRQKSGLIERQADHIDMIEHLLAANGTRSQARLRRSPWWTWRGLRGLLAGLPL